ncbi:DUF637 domain-containing protein [Pseudomonas donghuensis]|uniref:two-partner secretion domain-containing protein n=1 Tax=Pseudomonas donghuensis TaxID=1163398 RepID=UPI00029A3DA2|nr:DUF637 domain-containing protein [Pseudomonas donghuensis]
MDVRSPLNQCIALIIAGVMFLNPIVATAAQVTVDAAAQANTGLGAAGNGVPIINIATPNGSGLSNNTFHDYNVGSNGLILNNATDKTQSTQLGGIIVGNPNLQGRAAQVILNQVTGGNRSTLEGYTEVAGQAARVIVANPHGITCKGCGFINTPRATLTTGKPIMDGERLDRFQVDGGDIAIEGAELNTTNIDQFDLITRSAKLNANLYANKLNIVTGRNDVDADSLQASARADDGSDKPMLAIDSTALGGMYAGAIRLVGTEKGVGVKLAGNMAATTSDIQIDANGKLTLAQAVSARDLKITAQSAELTGKTYASASADIRTTEQLANRQSLAARESITVNAGQIDNSGIIEAGVEPNNQRNPHGDVTLTSQTLRNSASVVANRTLKVDSTGVLDNQGGSLKGVTTTVDAGQLDNRNGQVLADTSLQVKVADLDNRQGGLLHSKTKAVVESTGALNNLGGKITGLSELEVKAKALDNSQKGLLASGQKVKVTAQHLDNQAGEVSATSTEIIADSLDNRGGKLLGSDLLVTASGAIDNRLGLISARHLLDLNALSLDNRNKGNLVSQDRLQAHVTELLDNRAEGNLVSTGSQQVTVGKLDNRDKGMLSSTTGLTLHGETLDNRGGTLVADQSLTVTGGTLDNRDQGSATTKGSARVEVTKLDNSNAGQLQSDGRLDLIVKKVENAGKGRIVANGSLDADVGTLNQQGGTLLGLGSLLLKADHIDNQQGGLIGGNFGVDITAPQILNQKGEISSKGKVTLTATGQLDNQGGKVIGDSGLTLTVQRLLNQSKGLLAGRDGLTLSGTELLNSGGRLSSQKQLEVTLTGKLDNSAKGEVVSEGKLTVNAAELDNQQGGLLSGIDTLKVTSKATLNNQGGKLVTDAGLVLRSGHLDNSEAGAISAKGIADIRSTTLNNSAKGNIGGASILLNATQLDNSAQGRITAKGQIDATLTGLDQHDKGRLFSETGITLDLQNGKLVNRDNGLVSTPGTLLLRQIGEVDNSVGGEISSDLGFSLKASGLNNQGGRLVSADTLTLRIAKALDNSFKGVLSGTKGLDIEAASLDNSQGGTLASRGDIKAVLDGLLDNRAEGTLSAIGTLTVESGELNNSGKGLLSGNKGLGLELGTGKVDNSQGGQLITQGEMSVTSGDLDNRGGTLSSKQAMVLTTGDLNNSAIDDQHPGGRIHSDGALTLSGRQVDSNLGGEISAKGDLLLRVTRLIQRQGRLIGEQALEIDLHEGDLLNQGGLISAKGPLTLKRLGLLDNSAKGEVFSGQSFSLLAKRIDNQQEGRIISNANLTLDAATLNNSGKGLMSGLQGLKVKGGDLDNSAQGSLSSKTGALTVTLTGTLDNRDKGALASEGKQQLSAKQLDNRKGIISSNDAITLSVAERLDNREGGLISAARTLAFDRTSTTLDNRGGQINGNTLEIDGDSLDNSNGQITSKARLRATLIGKLVNGKGARLVSGGDLLLESASVTNNGGKLVSQGLLKLTAQSLDNSADGTLASQQNLVLRLKGNLHNEQNGLLFSEHGAIDVEAGELTNQSGALKSQGDIKLRLGGDLKNQAGRLDSQQGNLDLHASSIDNSAGGTLNSSKGWLDSLLSGLFDNTDGITQAQSLKIEATQGVNNQKGFLSALGGDNQIITGDFDNRGGGLYAAGLLTVQGQQFFNEGAVAGQGGKVGAGRIDFSLEGALTNPFGQLESEGDLQLRSSAIDNTHGSLRALGRTGTTRLISAGSLNNNFGVLETANQELDLQIGGLSNAGGQLLHTGSGTFGLASDKVMQAGGTLYTNGLLSISAASWTNSSVLQANRLELDIDQFVQTADGQLLAAQSFKGLGGNWRNDGLLASDGSFQLNLRGTYNGNGRASSLGELGLSAANIALSGTASIAGGGNTVVSASNVLTNQGRLTALGNLTASAATLNNYGTLGSATALRVNAGNLLNERGLIFSGNDMTLRVGNVTNNYADVYSLGSLNLAADDNGNRANQLENISGSIESASNMSLLANTLINRKEKLTAKTQLTSGNVNVYSDDHCKGKGCELYFYAVETYQDVIDEDSLAASITTGGNLTFSGNEFSNRYSTVSAARDITINTAVFNNVGVAGGEQRNLSASFYTRDRGQYNAFIQKKNEFNQAHAPGSASYNPGALTLDQVMAAAGYPAYSIYNVIDNRTPIAGAVVSPAVVQAAGAVTINASQRLDNSIVRANAAGVGRIGARGDASADPKHAYTSVRAITSQLPPDLAQRQVNPVTLPSFSLPQGDNGLFRISGQSGQVVSVAGALGADADRTLSSNGTFVSPLAQTASADNGQGQTLNTSGLPSSASAQGQQGSSLSSLPSGVTLVQGVPDKGMPNNSHKYLVETNPALTDLKQFLSSDYLLGELNIKPDHTLKRLGDGLYEQRLIREAVVARTGQRYIDGMASDETLFRYLMDNAIASKSALNLSLGVSLSAEQVAALTHDIVWMEEVEVNGEKLLAPVLYLAQAKGRVAPNGALIQGRDINLISGGALTNVGTLRATNNLSAAAKNISNSGLMEAGGRLDLLATDAIRNAQGGIISGREVSLTTLTGDVINERSVTRIEGRAGGEHVIKDIVDNAARIEAANDLTINAGRDIGSVGGVLEAGRNIDLDAGRDLYLISQEGTDSHEYQRRRVSGYDTTITQYGSEVKAGGNLTASAGQDLSVLASEVEARRDIALEAGRDVTLGALANEEHSYSKGKKGDTKTTRQEDDVKQQAAEVHAGGDLAIDAGRDLRLIASKASAGDEAYLVAGDKLELLAANDSEYSLYDMNKKGGWGSKQTQRDEVTDVKAVGSEITSGGNLTLASGGDQLYQGATLESGKDLTIDSGGSVTFEAVKDMHQESHEKSKSDLAWTSAKGEGKTDETLRQSQLVAQGELTIKAVDGLKIDIKHIDQATVSQSIDAMVKADPQLAWLKDVEAKGGIDWRQVEEIHTSFKYANSGLGAGAQLAIAILMAAVMGPAGLGLGTVQAAGAASLATTATVSTINNKGDLGAALKDTLSKESLKSAGVAMLTAGALQYADTTWFKGAEGSQTGAIKVTDGSAVPATSTPKNVMTWANASDTLTRAGTHAVISSGISTAVNGGSFGDNLGSALVGEASTIAMATGFNFVGDRTIKFDNGSVPKIFAHALMGGLLAEATGSDFKTGAMAAGLNEAMSNELAAIARGNDNVHVVLSQLTGLVAAAAVGGDLAKGAEVAQSGTLYNQQLHRDAESRLKKGIATLHAQGQFLDLQPEEVMTDLQRIVDGERDPRKLNPATVAFLNQFPPGVLREALFEPTVTEDRIGIAIDLFFPSASPVGKGKVVVKIANTFGKDALVAVEKKFGEALAGQGAKAAGQVVPDVISPTYRELQGLNKGLQAHHILPQYLGKMLGYTKNDMLDHPATLITQYSHTGKVNPDAMHKAISKYLPPMVGGKPATYTYGQISSGLQKAYGDIGRPELFDSIKHLIK